MRRRDFVAFLSGATAWAAAAHAQEPRRVIGVLSSASYDSYPGTEDAFVKGLKEAGFIDGSGISIEWRWVRGEYDRLPSLANELVSRGATVIVCFDAPAAFAAKAATRTIPIIFVTGADPVMSYGTPILTSYQQIGTYAGKILKGAKPADLPVQQSTNVELVINLKTARALGLTIPPSVLARADEVIE